MYEIEWLVRESVELVACSKSFDADKRNIVSNLYQIQQFFDCGHTYHKCWDLLENMNYIFSIEPNEHPLYSQHKEYFESVSAKGTFYHTNLYASEIQGIQRAEEEESEGYFDGESQKVVFWYGNPLWEKLKKEEGEENPSEINPHLLFLKLIEEANSCQNRELLYNLIGFALNFNLGLVNTGETEEELKGKYFNRIIDIFKSVAFEKSDCFHDSFRIPDESIIENQDYFKPIQTAMFKMIYS
ncbi:hypothetical protein [Aureibacter tunicatorum]|uniref:Uncharacterized protein n=1 Tax=Aureibacter tunicatorum TaxID=866807 RepID=A0AAE3XMV6_9BACT|nr:hypothetical protein [Aureibacter tunicatorum]MDR6239867.1 hypothetical protein [Aureibacter tunicatorum]